MSGFYKNGVDITSYASNWISNSAAYAQFSKMSSNFPLTLNTSYAGTFTSQIDEKLTNNTGYLYNGVDISTYMVSSFVESSTSNLTSAQIPSWCNKLRVVLIGAGAGGGTAQLSYYWGGANWGQQQAANNTHQCNYYNSGQASGGYRYQNGRYDNDWAGNYNQQGPSQNTAASGGGGGGGAFIYLPSIDISTTKSTVAIQVGAGGAGGTAYLPGGNNNFQGGSNVGSAGGATALQISSAVYANAGGGGRGGNAWEGGGGGGVSGQNTGTASNGQGGQTYNVGRTGGASGCTSTFSTNGTITSYGRGGSGSTPNQGIGVYAGDNGSNGYYRVYFLTS